MAVLLWLMGLALLLQSCVGQNRGCMKWAPSSSSGNDVCCEICHPGHRLVKNCGPKPQDLCTPCEPKRYTVSPREPMCQPCTQCVGVQVVVKECTPTQDTTCGCKEGLLCGDKHCTYCIDKCNKGQEPTVDRSCRTCPNGTFNDQIHQKCKPWSTKCPNPEEIIVDRGNASSDIKCAVINQQPSISPHNDPEQTWPLIVSGFACSLVFLIIIIMAAMVKMYQTKTIKKAKIPKSPIIRTPTDDPRTLIAIECSFHEAEQEEGSTQLLASSDSTKQLII